MKIPMPTTIVGKLLVGVIVAFVLIGGTIYGVSYAKEKIRAHIQTQIEALAPQLNQNNDQINSNKTTIEQLQATVKIQKQQLDTLKQNYITLDARSKAITQKLADLDKLSQTILAGNANDVKKSDLNDEVRKLIQLYRGSH